VTAVTAETPARSPLADRATDLVELGAELVPFLAQVDVRLDPSHVDLAPYPLPLEPNTTWNDDHIAVLWLGPDEWLILSSGQAPEGITDRLRTAFADVHHSVVDVSANRVSIAFTDEDRSDLLSHVCSLDLHPSAWGPGRCAQTMLGGAQAIVFERARTTPILVRPSFANSLVDLLLRVRAASKDMGA
jgi:sarcosine oxidase subunit gamma